MGANLDYRIVANILSSAPLVGAADFTTILLASEGTTFTGGDLVRSYNSAADVAADSELSAGLKAFATQFFAQDVHGRTLMIGEMQGGAVDYGDDLDAILAVETGFYGVVTDDRTDARILEVATWAQANARLAILQSGAADILSSTEPNAFSAVRAAASRALCCFHATGYATEAFDLAWAAYKLAADPDVASTTWPNVAGLAGITADTMTATQRDNALGDNVNVFLPFAGIPVPFGGKLADGTFVDNLIAGDWLAARIEEGLAQLLMDVSTRNEKVPYTEAGIAQIASVARKWLKKGEQIGHFRPGSSTVVVPALEDIADATIRARELTITAQTILAGAIDQTITVNIAVLEA